MFTGVELMPGLGLYERLDGGERETKKEVVTGFNGG